MSNSASLDNVNYNAKETSGMCGRSDHYISALFITNVVTQAFSRLKCSRWTTSSESTTSAYDSWS